MSPIENSRSNTIPILLTNRKKIDRENLSHLYNILQSHMNHTSLLLSIPTNYTINFFQRISVSYYRPNKAIPNCFPTILCHYIFNPYPIELFQIHPIIYIGNFHNKTQLYKSINQFRVHINLIQIRWQCNRQLLKALTIDILLQIREKLVYRIKKHIFMSIMETTKGC